MHLIVFKLCLNKTFCVNPLIISLDFPGGSDGKESACNVGDLRSIPGLGRSPWQLTVVFLLGEFPWTKQPGGLQPMGLQRWTRLSN